MTTSAFPYLDGRTSTDATRPATRPATRLDARRSGARKGRLARRIRRARLASGQRERARRYTSDAYLDRAGFSSVDLPALLTNYARR